MDMVWTYNLQKEACRQAWRLPNKKTLGGFAKGFCREILLTSENDDVGRALVRF